MRIQEPKNNLTTNIEGMKEAKVSHVEKLLFLLEEQYQFPLRTMVQEYLSNAKDACLSTKNKKVKIEVTLPSFESPVLKIRDYGVGMNGQEIEEVFFSYGASTKDKSNDEIGGFGVGGKSAFAYTDQLIITGFKDGKIYKYSGNKKGRKTQYLRLIEDTTQEKNGVCVEVPLRKESLNDDIQKTIDAVFRSTVLWETKPIILNKDYFSGIQSYNDFEFNYFINHNDFKVLHNKSSFFSDIRTNFILNLGGIPYEVNSLNYNLEIFEKINKLFKDRNFQIVANAPIGAFTLPVSREEIKIDEKGKLKAKEIFENVYKELLKEIEEVKQKAFDYNKAIKLMRESRFNLQEIKIQDNNYTFALTKTNNGPFHFDINTVQPVNEFYRKGITETISLEEHNKIHGYSISNNNDIKFILNDCADKNGVVRKKIKHNYLEEMKGFYKKNVHWNLRNNEHLCHEGIYVLPHDTNKDLLKFISEIFILEKMSNLTYDKKEVEKKQKKQIKENIKYILFSSMYEFRREIKIEDFDYENSYILETTNNTIESAKDKNGTEVHKQELKIINDYLISAKSKKQIIGLSNPQLKKLDQNKLKYFQNFSLEKDILGLTPKKYLKFFTSFDNDFRRKRNFLELNIDNLNCKTFKKLTKFKTKYDQEFEQTYNVRNIANWLSNKKPYKKIEKDFNSLSEKVKDKYPLLKVVPVNNVTKDELEFYINQKIKESK